MNLTCIRYTTTLPTHTHSLFVRTLNTICPPLSIYSFIHFPQANTRREVPPPASCAVQTTCTAREDPRRAAATSAGQAALPRAAQPRIVTRVKSARRGIHATAPLIRPPNVRRGLSRPRAVSIAPPAETTTCSAASALASARCVALEASRAAGARPLARRVPRVRQDPNAPAPVRR